MNRITKKVLIDLGFEEKKVGVSERKEYHYDADYGSVCAVKENEEFAVYYQHDLDHEFCCVTECKTKIVLCNLIRFVSGELTGKDTQLAFTRKSLIELGFEKESSLPDIYPYNTYEDWFIKLNFYTIYFRFINSKSHFTGYEIFIKVFASDDVMHVPHCKTISQLKSLLEVYGWKL